MLGHFTRQLNCNANYEIQTKVLQCLINMYFLASDRQNIDFVHKKSLVLTWPLFILFVCLQSAKPKRAAIFFYKM